MGWLVACWEKLPKSKRPSSKSFETVMKAIGDPFIVSKLHFFNYFSGLEAYDSFYVPIIKVFGIKALRDNC